MEQSGYNKINLEQVTFRNFLSYGAKQTVFNFKNKGSILIQGRDLDQTANGVVANGTGKTSILNAISYALYDNPVTDEIKTKDCLINNINKKKMKVTLIFNKRGVRYRIERFRKMKATADGTGVTFEVIDKDGKQIKDLTRSSKETSKAIVEVVGIPHELFKQIVLFSATTKPFLSLPKSHPTNPCQRDMIEHLFGFTELTKKARYLKELKKDTKVELEIANKDIEFREREITTYKRTLADVKDRLMSWESETQRQIDNIEHSLKKANEVDIDREIELSKKSEDLRKEKKREDREILPALETKLSGVKRDIANITHELTHLSDETCPYCKQSYTVEDDGIEVKKAKLEELQAERETLMKQIDECDARYNLIVKQLQEVESERTVSDVSEIQTILAQRERLQERIDEYKKAENPFIDQYQTLKNNPPESANYDEVNRLTKLLDHQEILIKLLTKNDSFVRKALIDKNLSFLNSRLNTYLADMGLQFRVEFTGNLEAKVSRFGRELEHGNVSNGQKARINIALSFAFRDVLQKLLVPFNVCFLDEALDFGLDAVGVISAAKLIKKKSREEDVCYYIISHRDEVENIFDECITVEMKGGFSNVVTD